MADVTKSIRLSITQNTQLENDVKKYHFKNASECLRVCHELFRKFMTYKDNMNDPDVTRKFLEETEPLFQAEKELDRTIKYVGKMTQDEMNRIFFAISLETNSRQQTRIKSVKDNRYRLQKGGVLEPKVGYKLYDNDNYQCYTPITPDDKEWNELSELDKITLRDELTVNLSELQQRFPNDNNMTSILDHTIRTINEQLEKEKKRI